MKQKNNEVKSMSYLKQGVSLEQAGEKLLSAFNVSHSGVDRTPERFANAMLELLSGYMDDPKKYLKVFDNVSSSSMIVKDHVPFISFCEHHLLPFTGVAHMGYLPNMKSKKVIGLSKLVRIFRCFSNQFQVQERIGEQFVDFIQNELKCDGCICVIKATHMCVSSRGVKSQGSVMTTSAIRGSFTLPEVRAEFMSLVNLK